MDTKQSTTETTIPPQIDPQKKDAGVREDAVKQQKSFRGPSSRGGRGGGARRGRSSYDRPRPEFEHKVINVRRVTRVVAGGRRFAFSVALVAGDRKGSVGVGIGKAGDTAR